MSEEQIKIWKEVEAKGLEKLENVRKALSEKKGFKEAHKDYCDFVNRLAETTGLTSGELDRHFTKQSYRALEEKKEGKEYDRGYMAKKKMQRTLYDMLQRFRREFGDSGGI